MALLFFQNGISPHQIPYIKEHYYNVTLHFEQPNHIGTNKPYYDFVADSCVRNQQIALITGRFLSEFQQK